MMWFMVALTRTHMMRMKIVSHFVFRTIAVTMKKIPTRTLAALYGTQYGVTRATNSLVRCKCVSSSMTVPRVRIQP